MQVDELVEHFRALERARGLEESAEATLETLYFIDTMKMINGVCVAEPMLVAARAALSASVAAQIDRLVAEKPRAARHWLGGLWNNKRPPSFDMSTWQRRFGIPDSADAYRRQLRDEQEQHVATLLARVSLDPEARAPDGLEAVFGVTIPDALAGAWRAALDARAKATARFLPTIRDVVEQTAFVAFEELPLRQLESAYPPPAMPPFLAFAKAREAVLFLDLTRPSGADFAVCRFVHDHGDESKVTSPTSAAWVKRQKTG